MRMHSNSLVYVSALRTNVLGTWVCAFFKTGICHNHKSTFLIIHVTAMLLLLQYSYNPDKKLIKIEINCSSCIVDLSSLARFCYIELTYHGLSSERFV